MKKINISSFGQLEVGDLIMFDASLVATNGSKFVAIVLNKSKLNGCYCYYFNLEKSLDTSKRSGFLSLFSGNLQYITKLVR